MFCSVSPAYPLQSLVGGGECGALLCDASQRLGGGTTYYGDGHTNDECCEGTTLVLFEGLVRYVAAIKTSCLG